MPQSGKRQMLLLPNAAFKITEQAIHVMTAAGGKLTYLPMAKFYFAVYPVRNLPSASETLADGKRFICRRQT
ncbi:MAG TPA: hypothetical protein IAA30_02680, partial [Candidatus Treponema faecavium]|nr:hypothetical protein [Candidatus Treponema faecavium]